MVYITDNPENARMLRLTYEEFKSNCTLDILGILEEYSKVRSSSVRKPPTLMDYLKHYAA